MIVDDLIKRSDSWLSSRQSSGVVISSRIRLARNISGVAFPGWVGSDESLAHGPLAAIFASALGLLAHLLL